MRRFLAIATVLAGFAISGGTAVAQDLDQLDQMFAQMKEKFSAAREAETPEDYCQHLSDGLSLNEQIVQFYLDSYEAGEIDYETTNMVSASYLTLLDHYDEMCFDMNP